MQSLSPIQPLPKLTSTVPSSEAFITIITKEDASTNDVISQLKQHGIGASGQNTCICLIEDRVDFMNDSYIALIASEQKGTQIIPCFRESSTQIIFKNPNYKT